MGKKKLNTASEALNSIGQAMQMSQALMIKGRIITLTMSVIKLKKTPVTLWVKRDREGSRKLRLQDFKTIGT
jgi:hypothetical protein